MITVIGIFANPELAEQVSSYLLANEFESENVDVHTHATAETDKVGDFFGHIFEDEAEAEHYATLGRNGSVVTVHAASTREAQEAVDAFNNHGAIEVNANDTSRSLVVNLVVEEDKRLRGNSY